MRASDGKQHHDALGAADDARDPDGLSVFSFAQAQEKARDFFIRKAREFAGDAAPDQMPYTVERALADYFAERERRGSKGIRSDRYAAEARILPALRDIEIGKLTTRRLRDWLQSVERAPKLVRTKPGAEKKSVAIDAANEDAVRSRKATANRVLTVLKAALNHAFAEGKAATDEAWRKVKPYKEVDAPIIRFLSGPECLRLVNGSEGAFRDLVRGALVTGCRYGELTRMITADFHPGSGFITVRLSKAGKPRHVALTDEGQRLFGNLTAGRLPRDRVFQRDDGKPWGAGHQQRPIDEASRHANIDPPATFHILRHTYASSLAMKGVSMRAIADQLGHADTRMTEKHYAHLASSYVADVVRAALPDTGIVPRSNIEALR